MSWSGHVARIGEERKIYKILVGKPEGKRPLGRQRRNCEYGIRMDVRVIGWGSVLVERIHLAQDSDLWRTVWNTVMNLRVLAQRNLLVSCS
jgi:hypothetical protein